MAAPVCGPRMTFVTARLNLFEFERGHGNTDCWQFAPAAIPHLRRYPAVPLMVKRPTICTAITFTRVIDGKIIA
jgi:hypothetical protein